MPPPPAAATSSEPGSLRPQCVATATGRGFEGYAIGWTLLPLGRCGRVPGALFAAFSTPATKRRRGGPARSPRPAAGLHSDYTGPRDYTAPTIDLRRGGLPAAHGPRHPESRGGQARRTESEARQARCGFLKAGNRAQRKRPGSLVAAFSAPAFSAPATEGRSIGPLSPAIGRARLPRFSRRRRSSARFFSELLGNPLISLKPSTGGTRSGDDRRRQESRRQRPSGAAKAWRARSGFLCAERQSALVAARREITVRARSDEERNY